MSGTPLGLVRIALHRLVALAAGIALTGPVSGCEPGAGPTLPSSDAAARVDTAAPMDAATATSDVRATFDRAPPADASASADAVSAADVAPAVDKNASTDAPRTADAMPLPDAAAPVDMATSSDTAEGIDTAVTGDAPAQPDAAMTPDAPVPSDAAPAQPCAPGTFDHDGTPATPCTPWSTCVPGKHVSNTPSPTTDRVCTECVAGTYTSQPNQSTCAPHDVCPAGTEQTMAGTSSARPVCAPCPAGTYCPGAAVPKTSCDTNSWDHDGNSVSPCIARTTCAAGQYVSAAGSATADRTCASCPAGQTTTTTNAGICVTAGLHTLLAHGGGYHTCAIRSDGTLRCWGDGSYGQLGYGHTRWIGDDEKPSSAGLVNVGGTVVSVALGSSHSCALLSTGSVRCWGLHGGFGYGHRNNIGDDETPASAGDVNVGGPVVQLVAGASHTCALLSGGKVRCWGGNLNGQLGYGNVTLIGDDELPSSAGDVPLGGTVVQLSAGYHHTCAVLSNGNVRCWGDNKFGQLGYGHKNWIGDDEPASSGGNVSLGGGATVARVSAGNYHTCVLLTTGGVRCWGWNGGGLLGYGHTTHIGDDETPASLGDIDIGGPVAQVSVSGGSTCAVLTQGRVRCWGAPNFGELGYGTNVGNIGDNETPASAGDVNVGGTVGSLSVGHSFHRCARLTTGEVRCWGYNIDGQLGYGHQNSIGDDEPPASAGNVDY